jgi:hypothetical protein
LIVFEGAEERVEQLSVGLLERLGIGRAPWNRDEDGDYYSTPKAISASNQLPSGVPLEAPKVKMPTREPVAEPVWDEDYYEEQAPRRQVMEARPEPPIRYQDDDDDEEDNWSEATDKDKYNQQPKYDTSIYGKDNYSPTDDLDKDAWDDDDAPKPINIPNKVKEKQPEYEEEGY